MSGSDLDSVVVRVPVAPIPAAYAVRIVLLPVKCMRAIVCVGQHSLSIVASPSSSSSSSSLVLFCVCFVVVVVVVALEEVGEAFLAGRTETSTCRIENFHVSAG